MSSTVMEPHVEELDEHSITVFGFWIYIMSDCILFATLFATHAVLMPNFFGGPTPKELFSMPFVLVETFLLLTSSFTYGLAMLAMHRNKSTQVIQCLVITFVLGLGFISMELYEFHALITEGNGWDRSASISSFFWLSGDSWFSRDVGIDLDVSAHMECLAF